MMKNLLKYLSLILVVGCHSAAEKETKTNLTTSLADQSRLIILGTAQDAGSPHTGCGKSCCKELWDHPEKATKVVSLGIVDPNSKKTFLFEATPDISDQMQHLGKAAGFKNNMVPDGIFLTHAHMGHYTGLMYLGKEALHTQEVPVYAMPRLKQFLEENGPWSQLVELKNIQLNKLKDDSTIQITKHIKVRPFLVPHRDEFSETVGYHIEGPNQSILFIPDIDKWHKWKRDIIEEIAKVDIALLDATFYDGDELPNRNMAEIPHPFVQESMKLFDSLPDSERSKIRFIHFNHTNPLLKKESEAYQKVITKGYGIAEEGDEIGL